MKTIKNAIFVKTVSDQENYKSTGKPEIILVGRSNVGKSSFINMLSNNSKLAKVSSTQGKTKYINEFLFNGEFVLLDLPGYGYAEVSKVEQQRWNKMIESYIDNSKHLVGAILLVDIRHAPTDQDAQMLDYLTFNSIPVTIVATKYDKIKKSDRIKNLTQIAAKLKVGIDNIFVTSAETSYGKQNLIDRIYQFIEA